MNYTSKDGAILDFPFPVCKAFFILATSGKSSSEMLGGEGKV
jgi:hypothetical protein